MALPCAASAKCAQKLHSHLFRAFQGSQRCACRRSSSVLVRECTPREAGRIVCTSNVCAGIYCVRDLCQRKPIFRVYRVNTVEVQYSPSSSARERIRETCYYQLIHRLAQVGWECGETSAQRAQPFPGRRIVPPNSSSGGGRACVRDDMGTKNLWRL